MLVYITYTIDYVEYNLYVLMFYNKSLYDYRYQREITYEFDKTKATTTIIVRK